MKVIHVGRSSQNDIVISDSRVSKRHCELIQDNCGNYWVIDLNSKNGTYVNDVRHSGKTMLSKNDQVQIGKTILPWQSYFHFTISENTTLPHDNPKIITIGRSPNNNIFINDPKASRLHCRIECIDNYTTVLEDMGSRNGTYVNGSRINRRTPLRSGDKVKIGSTYVPWEPYINPGGTVVDGATFNGTGTIIGAGVVVEQGTTGDTGEKTSTGLYGTLSLLFGLAAFGCIIYIVVDYFTSFGHQLVQTFGGTNASLKLFPFYLKGYWGIGGQWLPMIAAVVFGVLTDFVGSLDDKEDKLTSIGQWFGNVGALLGGVFIILAIFAEKIVTSLQ